MAVQKKFFCDFFDGQIIKEEPEKFKLFKLILTSVVSLFGLFCWLAGFCNPALFLLLELGMIWNFYVKLDNKISVVFCVFVSAIYFVIACNFRFYANAVVYMGFYIPFQLFALTKTYYGGSFVQIRKKMEDKDQIIMIILSVFLAVMFYMLNIGLCGRFSLLDAASASCLVFSAILRNERYNDYYYYRSVALILSIILWIVGAVEYQNFDLVVVAVLYLSYLVFDIATNIMQKSTYENEYMQICKKYQEKEDEIVIKQKLKAYKKQNKI